MTLGLAGGAPSKAAKGGGGGGSCKVEVGNLPRGSANAEGLKEICRAAGGVESAQVRVTKSKVPMGVVVMESPEAAAMAVSILNGADCNGRALRVRLL